MDQQRYLAYRSLLAELRHWRSEDSLEPRAYDDLCDAAEGLLLARAGRDAEEPLTRASTTLLGLLAVDELPERDASWLLDALLACGPQAALGEAA
jgi:hypothetical protein